MTRVVYLAVPVIPNGYPGGELDYEDARLIDVDELVSDVWADIHHATPSGVDPKVVRDALTSALEGSQRPQEASNE